MVVGKGGRGNQPELGVSIDSLFLPGYGLSPPPRSGPESPLSIPVALLSLLSVSRYRTPGPHLEDDAPNERIDGAAEGAADALETPEHDATLTEDGEEVEHGACDLRTIQNKPEEG
eukprot:g47069.t1